MARMASATRLSRDLPGQRRLSPHILLQRRWIALALNLDARQRLFDQLDVVRAQLQLRRADIFLQP